MTGYWERVARAQMFSRDEWNDFHIIEKHRRSIARLTGFFYGCFYTLLAWYVTK